MKKPLTVAILLLLLPGCGDNGTLPGPSENTVSPLPAGSSQAEDSEPFRKDLFDEAFRAAVKYSTGEQVTLSDELEILEPAIRSKEEKDVFKLFEFVLDLQTDLNLLSVGKLATEGIAEKFTSFSNLELRLFRQNFKDKHDEWKAFASINLSSGVVVVSKSNFKLNEAMAILLDHQKWIKPEDHNGVMWIPYESTESKLLVIEEVCLKTLGEVINNNGKVP